jgi:hypothetical protein
LKAPEFDTLPKTRSFQNLADVERCDKGEESANGDGQSSKTTSKVLSDVYDLQITIYYYPSFAKLF